LAFTWGIQIALREGSEMPTPGQLDVYRQELAKLQQQLEAFAAGTTNVSRMERGRWIDITNEHAEKVRRSVAHLEAVLAQYGIPTGKRSSSKTE
jgi:hypothetical protein